MAVTAIALPGTSYSAQYWRQSVIGGIYAHAANNITAIPGAVVGLRVSGIGGSQAQVEPGICVVSPSDGPRGSYQVASDAVVTLTLASPDTVYSRVDAIIVRVRDAAFGDATTGATIEAVTGTPSVSPVAPATPDGALLLGHVTVQPSGATAAIDQRLWTAAIGGVMSGTRAQRLALPTLGLRPGQSFTENADAPGAVPPGEIGQTWRWNGTQWLPQFITGFRAYIGQVMRPFSWDYQMAIEAGRVIALPLRKAHGAVFDERNNLDCTVVNGTNIRVPYAGRYRMVASVAADSKTTPAEFFLGIRRNLNAAAGSPGTDIGAIGHTAGTLLDEQPRYMGDTAANASHTVHAIEVPQFRLAANDTLSVTLWHNATSTQQLRYENPYVAYLDITRLGD